MSDISTTGWYAAENATFGDRLAAGREAAGMTQNQLAKRLGVKTVTLRGWEDDLSEPRANRLQMLSGLLGVSLPWLLTGVGDDIGAPGDTSELPVDIADMLSELRDLRADLVSKADRLAILEKRLRAKLQQES